MSWYRYARTTTALRKHMMRVDLHVHAGDEADYTDEQIKEDAIRSILSAAVIKGLDVIGIVAHDGLTMGQRAINISANEQLDLWVVAGHEYLCTDKFRIIAYNINQPVPPNLTYQQAAEWVHKNKGLVMIIDLTKRQAQIINKLKGTSSQPDAVELYNAEVGWFMDIDVHDYYEFMNSAAKSAKMLEDTNVYTLINRKDFEQLGFMPEGEGTDYVPKYLQKSDELEAQKEQQQAAQPAQGGV